MAIRAQPVKSVFQRMPRLVREVAAPTGKNGAPGHRGRGHRGRQDRDRAARRSADPHDPQRHRPRPGNARRRASPPASRREGVVRLSAAAPLRPHRHRGRRRRRAASTATAVKAIADREGPDRRRRAADRRGDRQPDLPAGLLHRRRRSPTSPAAASAWTWCKRSIQALGGRISITSQAGQGLDLHHEPAADAGGARRHGGRRSPARPWSCRSPRSSRRCSRRPREVYGLGAGRAGASASATASCR